MDTFDKAYDRVCCEMDDILNKQKLDKQDVEMLYSLIDIAKDVFEIDSYQDSAGYSQMNGRSGTYMRGRSGRMMPMYDRNGSYGRDSGYSRSSNKDVMLDHLQDVMDMAVDEKDRKAVERLMQQMSER